MAKGYWVPQLDVSNPEGYKAYTAATPEAHRKFAGRALARGGKYELVEGRGRSRNVLREFPDYATALACYRSGEYQRARPLRLPHSACDFVIAEGYEGAQPPLPATPPPAGAHRGYWIAHADITDPEGYKAYMTADMVPLGKFGARFLVRGGTREVVEGKVRARTVVIEFPSYQAALDCYRSAAYQAAAALRKGRAEFDLVIVEGYDDVQHQQTAR
jgi:uncharacterized protein (DUF1330 family)